MFLQFVFSFYHAKTYTNKIEKCIGFIFPQCDTNNN